MSENNNLVARNKFVFKLQKKITEMNDSIALLAKVDDKLFLSQSGGSGLFSLGSSIANLEARAEAWKKAVSSTADLDAKLAELKANVGKYQTKIQSIIAGLTYPFPESKKDLDEFLAMNDDAYAAAKAVYAKAYELKDNSQLAQLDALKVAFKGEVEKVITDTTKSDPLYAAFEAQLKVLTDTIPAPAALAPLVDIVVNNTKSIGQITSEYRKGTHNVPKGFKLKTGDDTKIEIDKSDAHWTGKKANQKPSDF